MSTGVYISIAMYQMIYRCEDEEFDDTSEESEEKKKLSLRNCWGLFHVKALLSRQKNGELRPQ